ncbi:MAG: glycosyltransferase family 4 protein [Bacteroidota bacterium]
MATRPLESLAGLSDLRSILVIPFEDQELVDLLRRSHPQARLDVLSKEDMIGGRMMRSVSTLRKDHYDLACASLHGGLIQRNRSSVRFLLSFFRATSYAVRTGGQEVQTNSFLSLLVQTYPRLLVGSLLGLAFVILSYAYLLASQSASRRSPARVPRLKKKDVLFLRTDLAGTIQSGGSISHVKGMIGAFLKSGFRVTYAADARCEALPPEVQQISIPPLRMLDFFDEFQLLAFNFQLWYHRKRIAGARTPALIYQRHSAFGFCLEPLSRFMHTSSVLEVNASEVWVKEHWSRLIFRRLGRLAEASSVSKADVVSVISKGVKEQLNSQGLSPRTIVMNPNGVDPDEFHPAIKGNAVRQRYGFSAAHTVVGFIGTFAKWHGVETLIEAAIQSVRKRSTLRFLLVGDGGLRTALDRRVSGTGTGKAIVFTGLIPHSSAPQHLAACDILVSPHLGFEDRSVFFGSPTKLFEYMAMGKPVIASRLEQIGEIVVHNKNGLLMKPGDVDELVSLILHLAGRKELRTRLGKAARKDVVTHYTWEKNVERLLRLLADGE